jgi:hypothetical protein
LHSLASRFAAWGTKSTPSSNGTVQAETFPAATVPAVTGGYEQVAERRLRAEVGDDDAA